MKSGHTSSTKVVKIKMTSKDASGRMVVLLYIRRSFVIPLVVRLKKDKAIGQNMSVSNAAFRKLLKKNIDLADKDLSTGAFEELL